MLQAATASARAPRARLCSRASYNIWVVALSFAVIFSAYNALQNLLTTIFPTLGQVSLATLYAVAGVSVFFAPALTAALGARATMVAGAACYAVYIASLAAAAAPALARAAEPLVLVASAVIGFGAAILWVALGVFITQNSTASSYATNAGLFWAIFQLNNVAGNLATWAVFTPAFALSPSVFLGFAAVTVAGAAGLLLLRAPPRFAARAGDGAEEEVEEEDAGGGGEGARDALLGAGGEGGEGEAALGDDAAPGGAAAPRLSLLEHLREGARGARAALGLLRDPNMLLLLPIFFFSGAELAFWTGEFTQLLGGASQIGLVLSLSGAGEIAGGLALGRLSDAAGRSASLLAAVALYAAALALTCALKTGAFAAAPAAGGAPIAAFAAAFLYGAADASFNANSYAMCSQLYGGAAAAGAARKGTASVGAYTLFQLVQNAGSALWYPIILYFPLHDAPGAPGTWAQAIAQGALLALVAVTFVAVDLRARAAARAGGR